MAAVPMRACSSPVQQHMIPDIASGRRTLCT